MKSAAAVADENMIEKKEKYKTRNADLQAELKKVRSKLQDES